MNPRPPCGAARRAARVRAPLLAGLVAGLVAGLLAAAVPASTAAQGSLTLFDGTVQVEASSAWPEHVRAGWVPVRVRLANAGERERAFTLELTTLPWGAASVEVSRHVRLPAGASQELELLVPALDGQQRSVDLRTRVGGGVTAFGGSVLQFAPPEESLRAALLLRRDAVAETTRTTWEAGLSPRSFTRGGTTYPLTSLAAVPWELASTRPEAYTSVDLVLVSTEHGAPPREVAAALRAWAFQGGRVGFVGPDAAGTADAAGFGPWLEERLRLQRSRETSTWRIGHGKLYLAEGSAPSAAAGLPAVTTWQEELHPADQGPRGLSAARAVGFAARSLWLRIPGLEDLPVRGYLVLLVAFAVLIGPVNFYVVLRVWKRPPLLLATIPAIAVLSSLVILGVGVLLQGVDVREAVVSVTVLDQREHEAATLERRTLFAGLSAGVGLAPAAHTSVFGVPDPSLENTPVYSVASGAEAPLRGEFLPSRRLTHQALASHRTARGRLLFDRRGDARGVSNALDAEVLHLVLRDTDGDWHVLDGALPAGADARLERVTLQEARDSLLGELGERAPQILQGRIRLVQRGAEDEDVLASLDDADTLDLFPLGRLDELWVGGYVAVLAENPLRDRAGVEASDTGSLHVLFGVLPADEGDWR